MALFVKAVDMAQALAEVQHFLQMGAPAAEQQKGDLMDYAANTF